MATTDRIGFLNQRDCIGELVAVDCHRPTALEPDRDVFGLDGNVWIPEADTHDRLHRLQGDIKMLQGLGLVSGAPNVGVRRIGLFLRITIWQIVLGQPLTHFGTSTKFMDEVSIKPRLVDPQSRVGQQAIAIEALDVIALEGRTITPDVDTVFMHCPHQQGASHRTAQRGGVEICATTRTNVEGTTRQRSQTLFDQLRAAVNRASNLGAVLHRTRRYAGDVGLVVLPDVCGVGAGNGTPVAHPGNGHGRVQPAGEGDADTLPDRQGG